MLGIGPLVLIAVAVLAVVGFQTWMRRSGPAETARHVPAREPRISLLTEAVGYVGAVLILSGVISAVGQRWQHFSDWGHVAVLATSGALFLAAGLVIRHAVEPALQRLVSVTWGLAVAGFAAAVGVGVNEVADASDEHVLLAVGATAAGVAAALWLVRRHALQLLALFVGVVLTTIGLVLVVPGEPDRATIALALWAVGLGWTAAAWRGYLEPVWAGLPFGVLLALVAPSIGIDAHGWMYAVAIATAAAAMALSVRLQNTPLLAFGTVACFSYVTWMVVRYFGDSLGVPATLAFTGVLVLVLALVSGRLMRGYQDSGTEPLPSAESLGDVVDSSDHDVRPHAARR